MPSLLRFLQIPTQTNNMCICSYVLGDKDEALIPFPAVSDQANWMGDPGLRCLTCLGKFGPPVGDLRCEFCVLLYRLQDLVVSERFPQTGIKFVTPDLRGAYYKALEVADSYRHFTQGGPPPSETGGQETSSGGAKGRGDHTEVKATGKGEYRGGRSLRGKRRGARRRDRAQF